MRNPRDLPIELCSGEARTSFLFSRLTGRVCLRALRPVLPRKPELLGTKFNTIIKWWSVLTINEKYRMAYVIYLYLTLW